MKTMCLLPSQCAKNVAGQPPEWNLEYPVIHPKGYNRKNLTLTAKAQHQHKAKQALGFGEYSKVIGFITSGHFEKAWIKGFWTIL
ncbi:hypothetical protein OH492_00105 [Vibrio chagasii]|nr:hypothetical protein [Vibrio chagasii]